MRKADVIVEETLDLALAEKEMGQGWKICMLRSQSMPFEVFFSVPFVFPRRDSHRGEGFLSYPPSLFSCSTLSSLRPTFLSTTQLSNAQTDEQRVHTALRCSQNSICVSISSGVHLPLSHLEE